MIQPPVLRVLLIDDDLRVHQMVNNLLSTVEDISLVGQEVDGRDVVDLYRRLQPDVVLVDVKMPLIHGTEVTKNLLKAYPDAIVVALSSYWDGELIRDMLESGAKGYIVKDVMFEELISSIYTIHQGGHVLSAEALKAILDSDESSKSNLTPRELETLARIAQGLSNAEIALELGISKSTVKFHTANILEKLDVRTRSEALVLAAKRNWI